VRLAVNENGEWRLESGRKQRKRTEHRAQSTDRQLGGREAPDDQTGEQLTFVCYLQARGQDVSVCVLWHFVGSLLALRWLMDLLVCEAFFKWGPSGKKRQRGQEMRQSKGADSGKEPAFCAIFAHAQRRAHFFLPFSVASLLPIFSLCFQLGPLLCSLLPTLCFLLSGLPADALPSPPDTHSQVPPGGASFAALQPQGARQNNSPSFSFS